MKKPEDNSRFDRKKAGIIIPSIDPIYDVMSDDELEEASKRFSDLLEDDDTDESNDGNSKNKD